MENKTFVKQMRSVLVETKLTILRTLMSESADFKTAVQDMGMKDLADIASNDIDCRTLEAVGNQDLMRLSKVEAAIARIENGKYGTCAKCGQAIPKNRLEAIPYAVLCIMCKAKMEKRRSRVR